MIFVGFQDFETNLINAFLAMKHHEWLIEKVVSTLITKESRLFTQPLFPHKFQHLLLFQLYFTLMFTP